MMFLKYREKEKERLPQPEEKIILVSPHQMVGDITIIAAVCGLLGAKIFDSLEHLDSFVKDPIGAIFSFSGLAFYGGLIFGAAGTLWYSYRNKIPLLHALDCAAPGLILAYGIGRMGCQLAGDGDWGIVNTHPKPSWWFLPDWTWAFNYPHNVVQEGALIPGCEGRFCYQLPLPVYPTPFYETIIAIIIFFFLWSIRKKIQTPGMLFSIYLVLNGIERFFIEKIRVDLRYHFLGITATQAQIIAVVMIMLGVIGIILSRRKRSVQTLS
jgi:phosphatidylglycerol---prolipoprotein diacylglyceryl transferase